MAASRDRRDQKYSTISTVGADAKKGGAGGSYTWGSALDVPTDYQPVGYSQQQVTVLPAQYVTAAPVAAGTAPAPVISDASAFPTLGAPAAPVTVQGWGPGSQGRIVVQQPIAQVAPIRQSVELGGQHPRNTFARIPRTSTGGSTIMPAPAAIDWSASGTTGMQQAILTQSGNPAHLGPYQVQAAPTAVPMQVLQQTKPVYAPPKQVVYSAPPKGFIQPKVTQARGR